MEKIQPIEWPKATIGGREFTFRFAYAAYYQLTRWKTSVAEADTIQLAAAAAGSFDENGKWHSEGFGKSIDLADMMTREDEPALIKAVNEALKKAVLESESADPEPAKKTNELAPIS